MPPPCTNKPRRCEGCQTPIPLSRNTPLEALPQVPENLCPLPQRDARRPPLRKAESRRTMADVLDRGVRSRSEERRAGSTVRTPCRVRGECSIEGCERPRHARGWCSHHWRRWHRHGDPLASRGPRFSEFSRFRPRDYRCKPSHRAQHDRLQSPAGCSRRFYQQPLRVLTVFIFSQRVHICLTNARHTPTPFRSEAGAGGNPSCLLLPPD